MTESEIQNAIFLAFGREPDVKLWRNNSGVAEEPVVTRAHVERLIGMLRRCEFMSALDLLLALLKQKPRFTRYGLGVGSSDIVGIVRGLFVAMEVKTESGRVSKEQQKFVNLVNARGGCAAIVRSVDDVGALIERARRLAK